MALVSETAFGGDRGQRPVWIAQQIAGGAHLQSLLVFARSPSLEAAEDASHVNGMNSSFAGEIADAQGLAESFVQPLLDPAKPARDAPFRRRCRRGIEFADSSHHFDQDGIEKQRISGLLFECGIQSDAGPEEGSEAAIASRAVRHSQVDGAHGLAAKFNGEEPGSSRANLGGMSGADGIEGGCERMQFVEVAAISFQVVALEHDRDVG